MTAIRVPAQSEIRRFTRSLAFVGGHAGVLRLTKKIHRQATVIIESVILELL